MGKRKITEFSLLNGMYHTAIIKLTAKTLKFKMAVSKYLQS